MLFPEPKIHEATGIEQSVFDLIVAAIERTFESFPDNPLDLYEIALSTSTDGMTVRKTCYFLLATRKIKSSFFPMHRWCCTRLGENGTVNEIEELIEAGKFNGTCKDCGGIITGKDSVQVGMQFWKLGAVIK